MVKGSRVDLGKIRFFTAGVEESKDPDLVLEEFEMALIGLDGAKNLLCGLRRNAEGITSITDLTLRAGQCESTRMLLRRALNEWRKQEGIDG